MQIAWKWALPLLAAGFLCGAVGCGNGGDKESHAARGQQGQLGKATGGRAMANEPGEQVRFAVHGMHCEGCVSVITKALQGREGVMANQVSLADSVAVVTYDPKKVAPAELKALIEDLGYTVAEKI